MKKIFSFIIILFAFIALNSCSDGAFNEKYANPTTVSSVSVEKLFTGFIATSARHIFAEDMRYYCFETRFCGRYAQTFGFYTGTEMYLPTMVSYLEGEFGVFYDALKNFKKLEEVYESLSSDDQAKNEAYLMGAKVLAYSYLVEMMDVFGDLPWSDACKIVLTGQVNDASARYEKAEDLYRMVLDDLKTINGRFAAPMLTPSVFTAQDIINGGDFLKWRRWTNSLRLRVATRVASNGPLTAQGQAAIKEILDNPSTYPVVETNGENIQVRHGTQAPYYTLDVASGMASENYLDARLASGAMIQRMQNDRRLNILYCLAKENPADAEPTVYRGTDPTMAESLQTAYVNNQGFSLVREYGFFWKNNSHWNHQLFSAAEIWFIKAEAFQKGWTTGNAETAFKRAIRESFDFYFHYQENRTSGSLGGQQLYFIDPARPTDAEIDAFADEKWNSSEYVSKEDAIITQKWVNFGIVFACEAWSDLRRTGYPSGLVFPAVAGAPIPNVPQRWKYPVGERDYNRYYEDVKDRDTYYNKLFWAK